jgi:tRNA 2-thiouridine synthesizing protein B
MTTLHIVRQSAFNTNDFAQCIQVLRKRDVIVLIDDGCYNLHHPLISTIENSDGIQLNIIDKHATARAITIDIALCNTISMNNLVKLTLASDRVITWQ